jgi:hypothetical protein
VYYPNFATSSFATCPPEVRGLGLASASRTLGYIGLPACLVPVVGLPITFLGLLMGIVALAGVEPGKAFRAILLCSVGLLLAIGNAIAGVDLYSHALNYGDYNRAPAAAKQPLEIVNPLCAPHSSPLKNSR